MTEPNNVGRRVRRHPKKHPVYGVDVVHDTPGEARPGEARPETRSSRMQRPVPPDASKPQAALGQWSATAICGNDITSSCLYVAAICTAYAGYLAPLALLMVAGVLYLYRKVYAEVGGALPLNGGAYNALLNSTTKFRASIAACMTILSYIATAVISAKTAMEYLSQLLPDLPVIPATIGVLVVFAALAIIGISDSARVALGIFIFHIGTLTLFCVVGGYMLVTRPEILEANWGVIPDGRGFAVALFFGFASGLLGISGFESSANFVEEQQPGVFPKTLRNMWLAVTVFNPLIAFLALGLMSVNEISAAKDFLLADASQAAAGSWLKTIVAIDATLVLGGAVLTSFVGVGGLVRRMALDRCLPQFLLATNRRGTTHYIFLFFLALCTSIILVTGGDLFALAGVYTISFLGVMALFALGNMLLKVRRAKLPRPSRAGWLTVIVAFLAALAGIVGNAIVDTRNLLYFTTYIVPTVAVVGLMFIRIHLMKLVLILMDGVVERVQRLNGRLRQALMTKIDDINSLSIIFFTKGDDVANLNLAMLYVRANELTQRVRVVFLYRDESEIPARLKSDLETLDEIYPEIRIDLVLRKGEFGPEAVDEISKEYGVAKNYMFIGAPGERFPHKISDLGGVRLII